MLEKINVSAGVLFHVGPDGLYRVCLGKRANTKNHLGFWEFPGGKVEPGESLVAALHREIWEELQIKIFLPKLISSYSFVALDKLIEVHFFKANTDAETLASTSHDRIYWFTIQELQTFFKDQSQEKILPADQSMLKMITNSLFEVTS